MSVLNVITLECTHCRARATYDVAELRKAFGNDQNITVLPINLVPCPEAVARRDGARALRLSQAASSATCGRSARWCELTDRGASVQGSGWVCEAHHLKL